MELGRSFEVLVVADTRLEYETYCCVVRQMDPTMEVRGVSCSIADICLELRSVPAITIVVESTPTMDALAIVELISRLHPLTKILLITSNDEHEVHRLSIRQFVSCMIEKRASGIEELEKLIRHLRSKNKLQQRHAPLNGDADVAKHVACLSRRELDLLPLLASGLRLREAADQLKISYKTADGYRTRIFQKLGFSNRSEMIRFAIRNSLIQP